MHLDVGESYSVDKRWGSKLVQNGWVPIANDYIRKIHLLVDKNKKCPNPTQMMLIIVIISYKWDEKMPFPSLDTLAKQLGLKERAVRTSLKNLEERGLIRIVKKTGSRKNRYDVSPLIEKLENLEDNIQDSTFKED